MKLSAVQQRIIDKAKADIDIARTFDYPEWLISTHGQYFTPERVREYIEEEYLKCQWEERRSGIALAQANSRSIEKLAALGLIEIIRNGKDEKRAYAIDKFRLLNY